MFSRLKSIDMMCTNIWTKLFLFVCTLCACHGKIFRIAWLAPGQNSGQEINSFTSVAGLKLALTTVMANSMILNGHNIEVEFFSTDCTSHGSMQAAMQTKHFNPDVIIGPPCQEGMRMVAQLCTFWNLPVFSWYNPGIEFDSTKTYPTLVRMIPSLNTMGMALLHLFRQNKWSQFALIHDDSAPWTLYKEAVREAVVNTDVKMFSSHDINSTVTDTRLWEMFSNIKKFSWVVVFACPWSDIRRYMLIADQAGMGNGNYIFIHLDHQLHSEQFLNSVVLTKRRWMKEDAQDQAARRIYQSLIHVLLDPMNDDESPTYELPRNRYEEFSRMASPETVGENPGWSLPVGGKPDVYSLYLYDAILVWSVLVDKLHTAGKNYRDGKLLTQEAKTFFADGATGYFALDNNMDRTAKLFILYMANDGSFKPSQILRFNATKGYDVVNIKPLREQKRLHGGQIKESIIKMNTSTRIATTITAAPTKTMAIKTKFLPRMTLRTSVKPSIPPPPTIGRRRELTSVPGDQTTDALISKLLAKVQSLEQKIQQHEQHSHAHIPDHTHTPHPLLQRLSSTSTPPVNVLNSKKPAVLGHQKVGHTQFPHHHIHVPTQPTNHVPSATDIYRQQATSALVPAVFDHAHHPHHWHPHPHYPHFNQAHSGIAPGSNIHPVHVPATKSPTPTTTTATTTTLPPPTTEAQKPTPVSHEIFNGNGQIDEATLNRISSKIVDQLTGTTSNTTNIDGQEKQIVNDWLVNGLDEIGPGLLFAAQALRERRLLEYQKQRHYQQNLQISSQSNQQQTQNKISHNQAQAQPPAGYRETVYHDPFAPVLDPFAGLLGASLVW